MSIVVEERVPLAPFTTFHLGGPARFFIRVRTIQDIREAVVFAHEKNLPAYVLGGGSNVVMSDEGYAGVVIKNECGGIAYEDKEATVEAVVGAGVTWDNFVADAVAKGLWGIENLSGIPGSVGATPVQNVGAYGAEVKGVISFVEAFDRESETLRRFSNAECQFGYRDSFFKKKEGKRYIITNVGFRLYKEEAPNLAYKDVANYFVGRTKPSLREIRNAILGIRAQKFPDTRVIGTAGSFFKMPIVPNDVADALHAHYPAMPIYTVDEYHKKVIIAWILDHVLHMKGFTMGNAWVYEKHSLVLVANRNASANEVVTLAKTVITKVKEVTGLEIDTEVTIVHA